MIRRPPSSPLFPSTTLFRSAARQVLFANRPPLSYDALSIGLGSLPARPGKPSNGDWSFVMRPLAGRAGNDPRRSEEHTSELQSHLNLVCRLLLVKKKNRR